VQWYETLIQILILGLANGAVISLIALGYTLVYGIIELINFAHGDVYMIGTFTALTIVTSFALTRRTPPATLYPALLVALIAAMITCALLNVTIERLAYRRLRNAPRLAPLISAVGVSFILMNIGLHWKGASQVDFPNLLPRVDILNDVFGLNTPITLTLKDLFVMALAAPLWLVLTWFVSNTRLGKAMRATAQDREAAALMGIDINQTIALTFLIGGALAGAAGFISGLYNNFAWFQMGFRGGLMAFTAAVLGGIGNITGAALGGLLIGVVAAFSDRFLDPRWTQPVIFGILILILVFRPSGLLGEQTPEKV